MAGDAYLPADGEIEAEHAWVNEWSEQHAAPRITHAPKSHDVTQAVAAVSEPLQAVSSPGASSRDTLAPPVDPAADQLLRDIVEIEFARDMLEREPVAVPKPRRRFRMPVVVGGMLGLIMVTAASVAAGLIKVHR